MIYCDWAGFIWIWSFEEQRWLIDLEKSGGPPAPFEIVEKPPFMVIENASK